MQLCGNTQWFSIFLDVLNSAYYCDFELLYFHHWKKSLEKMCLQTSSLGGEGRGEILGISGVGSVLLWWKHHAVFISLMPIWDTAQGSSSTSTLVPKSSNPPNLYPTKYHPASNLIFPDVYVPRPSHSWSVYSSTIDVFSSPGHPNLAEIISQSFLLHCVLDTHL